MPNFTPEEKEVLKPYVTSTEREVYAITGMNGIVGAAYARYSRSKLGFREMLLEEFMKDGEKIDYKHADELIERVLIAYGDDSVGELEGAHVSFENISILATKEIEDRRIGGSPLEKSTRYVFFDEKDENGKYKYVREPKIMASPFAKEYEETMDFIFDTYAALIAPMQEFYKKRLPLETAAYAILGSGQKQKYNELKEEKDQKAFRITYNMDIRTKACDSLRCLLPISTKTNMGVFGNGRFYQYLISHLISSDLEEVKQIGQETFEALTDVIKQYVRRAKVKEYNQKIDAEMKSLAKNIFGFLPFGLTEKVHLVPMELRDTEDYLVAHMLYPFTRHSFSQVYEVVKHLTPEQKERIKTTYVGDRSTRRDRPGRAFEPGYTYTFDMLTDFGSYKDIMRHRMNTQLRQPFSPIHCMELPNDLIEAGFSPQALECHEKVLNFYNKAYPVIGDAASYVALHGSRVRWLIGFNDREAMHLLEIRTVPQGHPQYRKVAQLMHDQIAKVNPWRASIMKFVDHNDYSSARGDSEAKQRIKEQQLDEKYGHSPTTADK